jgi:hypothetical protein
MGVKRDVLWRLAVMPDCLRQMPGRLSQRALREAVSTKENSAVRAHRLEPQEDAAKAIAAGVNLHFAKTRRPEAGARRHEPKTLTPYNRTQTMV